MVMHGGQAIPAFDFYLAPYVRKTFIEEVEKVEVVANADLSTYYNMKIDDYIIKETTSLEGDARLIQLAMNQTVKRVHQSMEAFIHNMNTIHSRGGNQVVFSSINYGTDTSAEGRCVIRELLLTTERGVGNGLTAIFPIQIWKLKSGVNKHPGDPNYDLYELACRVTARRFFPNFLNLDATFNKDEAWKAEDPRRFEHEVATMGCVKGDTAIHVNMRNDTNKPSAFKRITIADFWEELRNTYSSLPQSMYGYLEGEFIDLSDKCCYVSDQLSRVKVLSINKNPITTKWIELTFQRYHIGTTKKIESPVKVVVTPDHPWTLTDNTEVKTEDLQVGWCVPAIIDVNDNEECYAELIDISVIDYMGHSYDLTTESEHFNINQLRTHNCRTRVYENRHGEKCSIGRGNLSFSTINLPGLALEVMGIEHKGERLTKFFENLDKLIDGAAEQLYDRYKFQCEARARQFPLLMGGMWKDSDQLQPNDLVEPVLKHGTLGVGFIGLAECLIALVGAHHGESKESQELGLQIIRAMKARVDGWANKLNLNFSVLATPAEGLSGKFIKRDKAKYGIISGVTDKEYYTNSNHVPVYYHCSANHKAAIEGPYHELTRGGHIFYVEMDGDATHNVEAIQDIVKLMDKYNIGYCSVNHNRNRCMKCGYEDAKEGLETCPVCGSDEIDRLQRITGYLVGTTDRWNAGKLAELKDRVVHE